MCGEATKYGCSSCCFRKMYILLELEDYRVHAYETERLYKEKANDAQAVGKFHAIRFDTFRRRHSIISDRGTHFHRIFK